LRPLCAVDWWRMSTLPGLERLWREECGAGGECFFATFVTGLRHGFLGFDHTTTQEARQWAGAEINAATCDAFLRDERNERGARARVVHHDRYGWDPAEIARLPALADRIRALRAVIETPGNRYWGDCATLRLLCRSRRFVDLDIGFVIFTPGGVVSNEIITSHQHLDGPFERRRPRYLMMLYNTADHWQLVAYQYDRPDGGTSRTAVLALPERPSQLLPVLAHLFRGSWKREWKLTLGYPQPPPPPPTPTKATTKAAHAPAGVSPASFSARGPLRRAR
jgi:hypothetical protein